MNVNDAIQTQQTPVAPAAKSPVGFIILMGAALLLVGGAAYFQYARVEQSRLPVIATVPPFSLTERSGRTVTRDDLAGRVWVADFIFTSCAGPCPVMSRRMQALQTLLAEAQLAGARCVSISVDPIHDTPPVLREYAETFGAEVDRWLFLTGDKAEIFDLAINGFKVAVRDDDDPEHQVIHSTYFVLVDALGRIRGYYNAMTDEETFDPQAAMDAPMPAEIRERLISDIRKLRREAGR
jgi:cytochrome oxidase Cu insertion factor (SCO1/SenC/PrrC family)